MRGRFLVGLPREPSTRNRYGFTAAEMSKIARNLHARAKERIARERSKEFRGSIDFDKSSDRIRLTAIQIRRALSETKAPFAFIRDSMSDHVLGYVDAFEFCFSF